ncbi:MAG TPA: SAM-dependent chlorinase/fluorinase [Candidatus Acidoferrales bacterium]|nr:SAM-dependent chlorinase/fluorinase [Candidatus Acidoferrales bacterium]
MITFTSDFGLKDPYVAEMKGVILTINPKAVLIDITHQIKKFNVRAAAFALASAVPYFPEGTVHLAVVDPGVGTDRRAIVIQTKKDCFVGPDNGVLVLACRNQIIQHIYNLTNPKFMLPKVSGTFHGRDIFAPAAAYLDRGVMPADFGPEIDDPVTLKFAKVKISSGSLIGEVLDVDGFGNIITNITERDVAHMEGKTLSLELASAKLEIPLGKTYASTKPKEPLLLIGSHGFLELALNQASAAEKFRKKVGDKIKVSVA